MHFENVRKILIIKFKHIGDVLLSVPTLNVLADHFPGAEISYLVVRGTEAMVDSHPRVKRVAVFDRGLGLWGQFALIWRLRREGFDLSVDLCGGGDRGAIWSFLVGARYRLGTLPINKGAGMKGKRLMFTHVAPVPHLRKHAVMRDLGVVQPFGMDTDDPRLDLFVPEETGQQVADLLADKGLAGGVPFVVVHPTSRWFFKCTDDAAMGQVIDRLEEKKGLRVVLTSGPGSEELERVEAILATCKSNPVVLAGQLSLHQLAGVIARARLYLGVDSAPSHMAAALGVPCVVLFGPTGPYNWGPWPNNGNLDPYPNDSGVQRSGSYTVLQKGWDCVPCGMAGCEHSKISRCLMETTADEMMSEIELLLAGDQ